MSRKSRKLQDERIWFVTICQSDIGSQNKIYHYIDQIVQAYSKNRIESTTVESSGTSIYGNG